MDGPFIRRSLLRRLARLGHQLMLHDRLPEPLLLAVVVQHLQGNGNQGVYSIDILNFGHNTGHKTGLRSGPNSVLGH